MARQSFLDDIFGYAKLPGYVPQRGGAEIQVVDGQVRARELCADDAEAAAFFGQGIGQEPDAGRGYGVHNVAVDEGGVVGPLIFGQLVPVLAVDSAVLVLDFDSPEQVRHAVGHRADVRYVSGGVEGRHDAQDFGFGPPDFQRSQDSAVVCDAYGSDPAGSENVFAYDGEARVFEIACEMHKDVFFFRQAAFSDSVFDVRYDVRGVGDSAFYRRYVVIAVVVVDVEHTVVFQGGERHVFVIHRHGAEFIPRELVRIRDNELVGHEPAQISGDLFVMLWLVVEHGFAEVAGFESATFTALHRDIVLDRPSFCRATAGVGTFSVPF